MFDGGACPRTEITAVSYFAERSYEPTAVGQSIMLVEQIGGDVNAPRASWWDSATPSRVDLMQRAKVQLPQRRCRIERKLLNHVPQTRGFESQEQRASLWIGRLGRGHDGPSMSAQSDANEGRQFARPAVGGH
jgi:hypothetical protein